MAKKYKRGAAIKSITEFDKLVADKNGVVYWASRPRPMNYAFMQNLQYRIIKNSIKNGFMFKAIRIDK